MEEAVMDWHLQVALVAGCQTALYRADANANANADDAAVVAS